MFNSKRTTPATTPSALIKSLKPELPITCSTPHTPTNQLIYIQKIVLKDVLNHRLAFPFAVAVDDVRLNLPVSFDFLSCSRGHVAVEAQYPSISTLQIFHSFFQRSNCYNFFFRTPTVIGILQDHYKSYGSWYHQG